MQEKASVSGVKELLPWANANFSTFGNFTTMGKIVFSDSEDFLRLSITTNVRIT